MPRTLKNFFKKKKQDVQKANLVRHMSTESYEPVNVDPRGQNDCLINTTDQFDADPRIYTQDLILPNVIHTLTGDKYLQELIEAAQQVKQWDEKNCAMRDGSGSYSQSELKKYITTVEKFVDNNFAALVTNVQTDTGEYLNDVMSLICSRVTGLVPVLDHSELVRYLLDSYNQHLFGMLHMLMDRSSSVRDCFFLLQWVKKTYFGQEHKGCLSTQNCVLSVPDPFMLVDWLEHAKQKLLKVLQDNISTTLHNILQNDVQNGVHVESNEEDFIQVQLDVIQCLNAPIQASKTVSQTLTNAVQRLCCDELHSFIQKYMNAQKANEANLLCHFRTIYTCRQIRSYSLSIIDLNNDTDSSTLMMLEKMESQSLSSTQQYFAYIAKCNLNKYFNIEDAHLCKMMAIIQCMLATLPQMEQGQETKQLMVNAAYHSVTRAYLQCLMQKKYKKLEKRWNDVEKKIMSDAEHFHAKFAQRNGIDDDQKMVLLKIGELLQCRNVDALKLLCSSLYVIFPKESEEYIPALLHWRGELTRRQIKKIINVSREVEDHVRNGNHTKAHMWCCLC